MNEMNCNIERLLPRFILSDKNGYAIAKAIEHIFQRVADAAVRGVEIIQDPQKMPEWRLDELANELGCLYDFNGTIEQKRYWIENATYLYTVYGTPQAIYNFLEGYFQNVQVEEFWEYGGEPFHFRVTVSGESYDAKKIAWAQKAIENVKNVRSVLDAVAIDSSSEITVSLETDCLEVPYLYASDDELTNANDIADWDEIPVDAALTDDSKTDEGVTG